VIGNATNGGPKVYDVTKYVDDHPGGAEVLMDAAGTDADDLFEDIGHSKDARTQLEAFVIGDLFEDPAEKARKAKEEEEKAAGAAAGASPMLIVVIVAVIAVAAYFAMQQK